MCLWEANKRDFDPLEGLGKEMGSVSFCSAGRMGKRGNFAAFELWSLEGQGKKMDFAPFKGLGGKKGILRRWKGWMESVGIHREGENQRDFSPKLRWKGWKRGIWVHWKGWGKKGGDWGPSVAQKRFSSQLLSGSERPAPLRCSFLPLKDGKE